MIGIDDVKYTTEDENDAKERRSHAEGPKAIQLRSNVDPRRTSVV
jgi:hypothetical protein